MKDRPILFTAPMVRALLDDRKTKTRRLDVDRWKDVPAGTRLWVRENWRAPKTLDTTKPRDMVARKNSIRFEAGGWISNIDFRGDWRPHHEPADAPIPDWVGKQRPSIFLPRWASRLTLIIEGVKVERLQDISEADALAEGAYVAKASKRVADDYASMAIAGEWFATGRGWFEDLWFRIHGPEAWESNPWVAAISFRVIKANIDSMEAKI